jgi:hypothetical protein
LSVSNPVLVALANVRLQESSARENAAASVVAARLNLPVRNLSRDEFPIFDEWCQSKKLPACPARPATVAFFALDNAHLGIDRLLAVVESISAVHGTLADPTLSPIVSAALNEVSLVMAPRSWPKEPKEQKVRFVDLPYLMQVFIGIREQTRDRDVRKSQNAAAAEISKLKQQLEKATNATPETAPNAAAANA